MYRSQNVLGGIGPDLKSFLDEGYDESKLRDHFNSKLSLIQELRQANATYLGRNLREAETVKESIDSLYQYYRNTLEKDEEGRIQEDDPYQRTMDQKLLALCARYYSILQTELSLMHHRVQDEDKMCNETIHRIRTSFVLE